jgi:hypothetical protein
MATPPKSFLWVRGRMLRIAAAKSALDIVMSFAARMGRP